jgi:hypothetical protein
MGRTGTRNNPYEWNFLKMSDQRQRQSRGIDRAEQRGREGEGSAKKHNADEMPPLAERRSREFDWAAKHLPAEHPGLVMSALIGLEVAGEKQSTASVMARLEAQGRTAKQRRAKDIEKGRL